MKVTKGFRGGRLVSSRGLRSSVAFNPTALFGLTDTGWVYEHSDFSTLFQDAAGTIPVTAVGQPVGLQLDKSGKGNHRTQSISLNRPTLARHPLGGIRNLLTFTEQFDTAAWFNAAGTVNVVANTATAPNGTMTADKLVPAAATSWMVKRQNITLTAISHVLSVWAKLSDVGVNLEIFFASVAVDGGAVFNLSTGAVITSANCTTSVSADDGNGWRRYATIFTLPNGASVADIRVTEASIRNTQMTGNGSKGILVWGAQLEVGSTATAYQKVVSAFDVTEAGVPDLHYLSYDGINDSMATASFAWGTDKATVVAGVRKLSDAAVGIVAEYSVDTANSGVFSMAAPIVAAAGSYRFNSRGTLTPADARVLSGFDAPISSVLTGIGSISGDNQILRIDGTQVAQSTFDQGTGNFLTYPAHFGARAGTSLFFNGREYSQFAINRLLTTDELAQIEAYTAARTGISYAETTWDSTADTYTQSEVFL